MNKIQIYSTPYCGYCRAAKMFLQQKGVEYNDIDLSKDDNLRSALAEKYSWYTVPMIVINDRFIGGYDDLMKMNQSGELDKMLGQG
jgi:glutaredoxin 3